MTCSSCVDAVKKVVGCHPEITNYAIDLEKQQVCLLSY